MARQFHCNSLMESHFCNCVLVMTEIWFCTARAKLHWKYRLTNHPWSDTKPNDSITLQLLTATSIYMYICTTQLGVSSLFLRDNNSNTATGVLNLYIHSIQVRLINNLNISFFRSFLCNTDCLHNGYATPAIVANANYLQRCLLEIFSVAFLFETTINAHTSTSTNTEYIFSLLVSAT